MLREHESPAERKALGEVAQLVNLVWAVVDVCSRDRMPVREDDFVPERLHEGQRGRMDLGWCERGKSNLAGSG